MTFYCLIFFFHAQLGYWRQTHCQVSTACYFPMYDVFKNPFKSLPPCVLQGFCMDEDRGFGDVDSGVSKLDLFCLCFFPPSVPCVAQHGMLYKRAEPGSEVKAVLCW